jgi:adenosine deaminase
MAPDYAEIHRHLGGAVHPKILFGYLQQHGPDIAATARERDWIAQLLRRFPDYEGLRTHFASVRPTLDDYLELHKLVEPLQTPAAMAYFLYRIARGARVFEHVALLELRFCPYLRTDLSRDEDARIAQMEAVVEAVGAAARHPEFGVDIRLVLCLHSALPDRVNEATVRLALARRDLVRGVDLAGPERLVHARVDDIAKWFKAAADAYLPATAHMAESDPDNIHPRFFPYLRRIGHGVQIALHQPAMLAELSRRDICFELCPSTYLQTGTFKDLAPLRQVTARLDEAGVPYCFATDNPAFNGRYLQAEYELALNHDVIDFRTFVRCRRTAFANAF